MQNDQGTVIDLYIPRKCNATHQLISSDDHASVQINIAKVDEQGKAIAGSNYSYAFCGKVRDMGEADDSLNRLAQADGILHKVFTDRL